MAGSRRVEDLTPEALEKKRAQAREYQRRKSTDPEAQRKRQEYYQKLKERRRTDPEFAAKLREREKRYRQKSAPRKEEAPSKKQAQKDAFSSGNVLLNDDGHFEDGAIPPKDVATVAALANVYHGYTELIAEYRRGQQVILVERMLRRSTEFDDAHVCRYRVKSTTYYNVINLRSFRRSEKIAR